MFAEHPFGDVPFADLLGTGQSPAPPPGDGKRKPILRRLRHELVRGRTGAYRLLVLKDFPVRF
jgi:hypothetical protein